MNISQALRDCLDGVLGRDVAGKPIKAGDLVEPAVPPEQVRDGFACQLTVVGPSTSSQAKPCQIDVRNGDGGLAIAWPSDLRKIDPGAGASWDEVGESTGWTPRTVTQPDEVPA